ncbi:hypothetical protein HOG21_07225 [bacterium]|nr:hypothetical protein [bacterium]
MILCSNIKIIPEIKLETIVCNQNQIHTDNADIIIAKLDKSIQIILREVNRTIVIII